MEIRCIWEHNGGDTILYAENFVGACTRGATLDEALGKMTGEVHSYLRWCKQPNPGELIAAVVQEKDSTLTIRDADSDVLFDSEQAPLTPDEYFKLKALALKSAGDFYALYQAIPDPARSALPHRTSFYGAVPRTGSEMYQHTKNVNAYYFGEIGIDVDNEGTILSCRERGFALLEQSEDFLSNRVFDGSYGEQWCLRKVLRRFIWHDRIHARAMWRMAQKTFGSDCLPDLFQFDR